MTRITRHEPIPTYEIEVIVTVLTPHGIEIDSQLAALPDVSARLCRDSAQALAGRNPATPQRVR